MLGFCKLYIMFSRKYHQKHREENIFVPAKRLVAMGFLKSVSCGNIEKEGVWRKKQGSGDREQGQKLNLSTDNSLLSIAKG